MCVSARIKEWLNVCLYLLILSIYLLARVESMLLSHSLCVYKCASSLLIPGVRCGGTSYIIDLSLRFAHVAPPGDGVPGGRGLVRGSCKPALEALNISEGHFHLYNGNYPSQ